MADLDELLARNRALAEHRPGGLPAVPRLGLIVLTCVDGRADPAHFLGLEPGDAMVLRFPAGRLAPPVARAVTALGAVGARVAEQGDAPAGGHPSPHLMIVHHTDCGVLRLDRPEDVDLLVATFEIPQEQARDPGFFDSRAAVTADVAEARRLVSSSGRTVSGHVLDVDTGLLETVVR